jgi:hypothetical protein
LETIPTPRSWEAGEWTIRSAAGASIGAFKATSWERTSGRRGFQKIILSVQEWFSTSKERGNLFSMAGKERGLPAGFFILWRDGRSALARMPGEVMAWWDESRR